MLRACFKDVPAAWTAYLEYSPAAASAVQNGLHFDVNDELLQLHGPRRFKIAFADEAGKLFGHREKLEALAKFKLRQLVRIGFIEFATDTSIENSTAALSSLADFCLNQLLEFHRADANPLKLAHDETMPFSVIGLGKLGGMELNFSSDIDIMFIYGHRQGVDEFDEQEFYNRLGEKLSRDLSVNTACGQLYRVDLRLRPEGDTGPVARSVESYEAYYAAYGEIWERLALLKSRCSAGDPEVFYEFSQMQLAFCYARNLLPEAIAEIPHLKERTEKEIVGNNGLNTHVKLGIGGIRDIEFFVNANQLLLGARNPTLQNGQTLKVISSLADLNLITAEEESTLHDGYLFWRRLEHRIQMREHRQTHSLPTDQETLDKIARSLDYANGEELWQVQMEWRKKIRAIYDSFFNPLRKREAVSHDFNFEFCKDPEQAKRNWHSLGAAQEGFNTGKRTEHAFNRFAPLLYGQLSKLARPDLALSKFVAFVGVYGSRSLLFESLTASPKALEVLLTIFDCSQYLSEVLMVSPEVFEETARADLDALHDMQGYREDFNTMVSAGRELPTLRLFKRQQMVRLLIRRILQLAEQRDLQLEYTNLADFCLQIILEQIGANSELAVIGLGKHGGQELWFGSDLDVLIIGANDEKARDLVKEMKEQTPQGSLFQVDVRLRPYGEGALAYGVDRYVEYYRDHAQLWEIQALGKARFAAGDKSLGDEFFSKLLPIWQQRCQAPELKQEMLSMRQRILEGRCKSGRPELEFKTGAGGTVDVEFAVQYWLMRQGTFEPNTFRGLVLLSEEFPEQGKALTAGYTFLRRLESLIRLDDNQSHSYLPANDEERGVIAKRFGFSSLADFDRHVAELRGQIRGAFDSFFAQVA
ncbi:MAG: hypothetical protein LBH01_10830 [Verrucomicrobiales bacterium]|jgi:glutamate-ammonia-ligase adenylyltransferase|nr:hypothetical protein [Verrucomicrobiales bacterium]